MYAMMLNAISDDDFSDFILRYHHNIWLIVGWSDINILFVDTLGCIIANTPVEHMATHVEPAVQLALQTVENVEHFQFIHNWESC